MWVFFARSLETSLWTFSPKLFKFQNRCASSFLFITSQHPNREQTANSHLMAWAKKWHKILLLLKSFKTTADSVWLGEPMHSRHVKLQNEQFFLRVYLLTLFGTLQKTIYTLFSKNVHRAACFASYVENELSVGLKNKKTQGKKKKSLKPVWSSFTSVSLPF